MRKPRLLDGCCCAGGAAAGYARAGFEVTGVDHADQPRYPYAFIKADILDVLADQDFMSQFAAAAISPPCQKWALASRHNGREYPDLIDPVRQRLLRLRRPVPWAIENVPGAPVRADFALCGCMFDLEVPGVGQLRRERRFETSWRAKVSLPEHDHHGPSISIAGHGTPSWMRKKTGHIGVRVWREVMGIDWMRREELTEAIPPAYGFFAGQLLMEQVMARAAR